MKVVNQKISNRGHIKNSRKKTHSEMNNDKSKKILKINKKHKEMNNDKSLAHLAEKRKS